MRVIYPYTDSRTEESSIALSRWAPQAERVFVGETEFDYGWLLGHLWNDAETFLIIEHDIVIHEGLVEEFEACDEEWCSSPYSYFNQPVTTSGGGLGCTKFSAQLMHRWPEMIRQAMEIPYPGHAPWHWCGCDYRIYTLLKEGGSFASQYPARRHQTHTEVQHRAGLCSHGCKDEL